MLTRAVSPDFKTNQNMADQKKLDKADVLNIAEQPDVSGVRIHPNTWEGMTSDVETLRVLGGTSGSPGEIRIITKTGPKRVILDDTLPQEIIEPIKK
jgi:hypothetical protein